MFMNNKQNSIIKRRGGGVGWGWGGGGGGAAPTQPDVIFCMKLNTFCVECINVCSPVIVSWCSWLLSFVIVDCWILMLIVDVVDYL